MQNRAYLPFSNLTGIANPLSTGDAEGILQINSLSNIDALWQTAERCMTAKRLKQEVVKAALAKAGVTA